MQIETADADKTSPFCLIRSLRPAKDVPRPKLLFPFCLSFC
jgi:hypothetical protein